MSERSKGELYIGILAIAMGVLYGGIQLLSLSISGEYTEYFDGWWLAFEVVVGLLLLLRYRSDRFRQFTKAVGESTYFRISWALLCLGFGALGAYLAILTYFDLGEEGATIALGLGIVFAIIGFATAGKIIWDTDPV